MLAGLGARRTAAACALAAAALAAVSRKAAQAAAPPMPESQLDIPAIPGDVARPLAFGFRVLVADVTFIEAIQLLAVRKSSLPAADTASVDRRLRRLLEYSVELDPKFAGAYRFSGAALPHETTDGKVPGVLAAVQILEKGVRERPDDWHIPFLLGFLQTYYLADFAAGARNMAAAARTEGAPRYVGLLATRLAAQGGELQMATMLAEAMLSQTNEEETRKEWQERVDTLHMERDLRELEQAVKRYRADRGALPGSLRALVRDGYLRAIPEEPHGGEYVLDPGGEVRSTGGERLQIHGGTAHLEVQ